MRIILIMLGVVALSAWGGWSLRNRDPIAAFLLLVFAGLAAAVLIGVTTGVIGT